MPYVDKGERICRAKYDLNINKNDIILTYPTLMKVNQKLIVYPPLSLVSDRCNEEVESPTWIDGYRVKGNEKVEIISENTKKVVGEIEIKCSKILPAFTLKKILGTIEVEISQTKQRGYTILSIKENPLISIDRDKVILYSPKYIPILRTFAYSLFYYISSEESE